MRDSYIRFFSEGYISKEEFFDFGLKETIYSPFDRAEREWELLKNRIHTNEEVFIRGFGKNASGTPLFKALYLHLVGNSNVTKDHTNNAQPTKIIRQLTRYSKKKSANFESIRNYQISHIFGRTKNVYAFTAPWNIVYMPKMLDPFTGHEAKGDMIDEYTILFQQQGYQKFARLIDDFNEIISSPDFKDKLNYSLDELSRSDTFKTKDIENLRTAVKIEFMPIEIQT